jgi:hypothetical protein
MGRRAINGVCQARHRKRRIQVRSGSISAPLHDDICREVLLKDQGAFDEWMKQQSSLQNWRKKGDVGLPKKAEEERERYAKAKRERM